MSKSRFRVLILLTVCMLCLAAWAVLQHYVIKDSVSKPALEPGTSASASVAASNAAISPQHPDEPRSELLEAPESEKFDHAIVKGLAGLRTMLTPDQAKEAWAILQSQQCASPDITIYYKSGVPEKVLHSECQYLLEPAHEQTAAYFDVGYGIIISVTRDKVYDLKDIVAYKFMYESGELKAVTNLNKDGHLQLWLDGIICEGEGHDEPDASTPASAVNQTIIDEKACMGTSIVQILEGELQEFKKR